MKIFFGLCISLFCLVANAQLEDETLFKIDNRDYKVSTFLKSFHKNSDIVSSSTESIEEHLERFINFRLKLKSAYNLQLDTLPAFRKEFRSHYEQIADNYISNGEVTEAMVKEAYDRTKTEVRVSHILLKLPEHEKDTAEVYQQAVLIKKRIDNGEPFEQLAKQYSEDTSRNNGGDLNWFNTFTMVYEFEDASYKLELEEVSEPVRTEYGYHIIKKTGERPTKGKMKTAHILLRENDSLKDAEERLNKIYKRLEDGEDFHELAKQYSQDENSASKGGYINSFSLGGLNSKIYENETYELENEGDFSKPFKTRFGWHIVKLIEIEPLEPFEEVKDEYKKRLKSSSRSKILVSKIKENLENLYTVKVNEEAKDFFLNLMGESFKKGKWKYEPTEGSDQKFIIQVEDRSVDYNTFGKYLQKKQLSFSNLPPNAVVLNNAIDELVYRELLKHHKTKLPEIDEEFNAEVEEYKNGILIFDYMKKKVWDPVSEDTIAQKKYYEAHKNDFREPQQVKGQLYTSKSKSALKSLRKDLKSLATTDTTALEIPENVIAEEVSLDKSSPKLPDGFKFEKGISKLQKHSNQFSIMNVNEIKEARVKKFEEVKGKIIGLLQEDYNKKLIEELRDNYNVVVNNEVLNKVKERLEE